ncbi:MAG: AraC family transcriptional regulator [Pseudomonadota bacterium]
MKTWRINKTTSAIGLKRWQSGLAAAFVRIDAEQVGGDEFAGRIEQVRMAQGQVSRVCASAHRVVRRAEHAAQRKQDVIFANLQLCGRGRVEMSGTAFEPEPSDLCIIPTAEPYSITHKTNFDLLSFAIRQDALPQGVQPGILRLSRSAAGRELGNVFRGLGALAIRAPKERFAVEQQISVLLSMAASIASDAKEAESDDALRAAICAHIDRMHHRPDLSAAPIAAAFDLTERRLHALFEATGQSVGDRIETARLSTATTLLRDTGLPVAVVARRSGYRDPSYFARVFRRHHHASPRDWRAAQLS